MCNLKVAISDENMVVGKSKYLVILYLYELTQPSDPLIIRGPLILIHTSSNLLTKEICPAPSRLNKSGTHPCPPAMMVLGEIQMHDNNGKN